MNCTAPRPRVSAVPIESLWVKEPCTMYVQISMFWWPCVPNPRLGWTRSSFITRSTPNSLFSWLLYSAKEKWKRLLSQLALDHPRLSPDGFAGFPNHSGGGSETKSLSAGTFRTFRLMSAKRSKRRLQTCQVRRDTEGRNGFACAVTTGHRVRSRRAARCARYRVRGSGHKFAPCGNDRNNFRHCDCR